MRAMAFLKFLGGGGGGGGGWAGERAVRSPVQLCLEPEFNCGHGALRKGKIDDERFVVLLTETLPQAVDGLQAREWIADHDVIDHALRGGGGGGGEGGEGGGRQLWSATTSLAMLRARCAPTA